MAQSIISILRSSAQISYNNSVSGLTAATPQAAIDEVEGRLDTAESSVTGVLNDVANLVTLTGVLVDSVNFGAFTGSILSDTETTKSALQALETAAEEIDTNVNDLITLSGVAENASNLGTFTGTTISDSASIKGGMQELETAHEEVDANVNDLITLSGVAENATDYGTFTGTIIPDSSTSKGALQALETQVEALTGVTMEFANSVLDYVVDNTAVPATEVSGDRYILSHDGGVPHANYDGASAGDIVEFNGTTWDATTPTIGTFTSADDETNVLYYFGGTWTTKAFENTTASTGLTKVGNDIRIADASANAFSFVSGVASVLVDDTGIEISANALQLKDLGVATAKLAATSVTAAKLGSDVAGTGMTGGNGAALDIDFGTTGAKAVSATSLASTANGLGASLIGVEDAGSDYTATTQEGVNAEIADRLDVVEGASGAWTVVTGALTMASLGKYAVDTTSSAFTVTLPATPSAGDSVRLFDGGRNSETNNITLGRNGENINGVADDAVFDTVDAASVDIVYINGTIGWSITAI